MTQYEQNVQMPHQPTPNIKNSDLPVQGKMDSAPGCNDFNSYPKLLVKQATPGFFQEMMGCEARTEFQIKKDDNPTDTTVMYAIENSSCILRRLFPLLHSWTMGLWSGNDASGKMVVSYERPCRVQMLPMKCCCSQELTVNDAITGGSLGRIVEDFYYCVPRFMINDENDETQYILSQPTCWGECA